MALCRLQVHKLGIDLITHDPVMILVDESKTYSLPISIGVFEATAIALAMEGAKVPRPTSHDLINSIIAGLDAEVEKVVITNVVQNTFYASLFLTQGGKTIEIDARPSDGVAVAIRAEAPIYVEEHVLLAEGIKDTNFDSHSEDDVFYIGREDRGASEAEDDDMSDSEADGEFSGTKSDSVKAEDDADLDEFIQNLNPDDFGEGE